MAEVVRVSPAFVAEELKKWEARGSWRLVAVIAYEEPAWPEEFGRKTMTRPMRELYFEREEP